MTLLANSEGRTQCHILGVKAYPAYCLKSPYGTDESYNDPDITLDCRHKWSNLRGSLIGPTMLMGQTNTSAPVRRLVSLNRTDVSGCTMYRTCSGTPGRVKTANPVNFR